jgi:hypothetical protein
MVEVSNYSNRIMMVQVGHLIHQVLQLQEDLLVLVGTQAAAIIFGGYLPAGGGSLSNATEEWTGPGAAVTKTITVS